ncbi:MAG TPA: hypothetical protein VLI54_04815 [Bacillota bacterium]|nr:hypothetical protein [Bacillota bacterium]
MTAGPGELSAQADSEVALLASMGLNLDFARDTAGLDNEELAVNAVAMSGVQEPVEMLTRWMDTGPDIPRTTRQSSGTSEVNFTAEYMLMLARLAGAVGLRVVKAEE